MPVIDQPLPNLKPDDQQHTDAHMTVILVEGDEVHAHLVEWRFAPDLSKLVNGTELSRMRRSPHRARQPWQ